jgi:hypothetical protein
VQQKVAAWLWTLLTTGYWDILGQYLVIRLAVSVCFGLLQNSIAAGCYSDAMRGN